MNKSYILILTFFLTLVCKNALPETESGNSWLTGFHSDSSLRFFFNQDDGLEEDRYLTEGIVSLEYIIFSKDQKLDVLMEITLASGMGESVAENLPFSPLETRYNLTPFIEYKQQSTMYRLGWNHGCKHLIYKDNSTPWYEHEGSYVEPDVYFNRIFIGIGPQSIRRSTLKKQTFAKNKRLTWYLEAAHYLESIGSIFDSDSLSGGHDWKWDFELHLKYPLLVNNSAALFLNNNTTLLLDGDTETFWRDLAELELMFGKGELGSSVFVGINLVDEHPRDSREGIGEAGFRFFF